MIMLIAQWCMAMMVALCVQSCRDGNAKESEVSRETFDFNWSFKYFGAEDPVEAVSFIRAPQGSQSGHPAELAMDGKLETRWTARDEAPGYKLILETGVETPLKSVDLYWEKALSQEVQVIIETAGGTERRAIRKEGLHTRVDLGGQTVRKLTIVFPQTQHNQWAGMREIVLRDINDAPVQPKARRRVDEPAQIGYDASDFKPVQIPHDWAIESPFLKDEPNETGKLPWNGYGWYRKWFDVPPDFSADEERYYLDFEGVMSHPRVYVNGRQAGEWAYGYSSFRVDITPYLRPGERNLVAVLASNKQLSTRWYPGAGIYRHVWLVRTRSVHLAYNGIYVTTPEVSEQHATVKIRTEVENTGVTQARVTVEQRVAGEEKIEPVTVDLAPGETRTVEQTLGLTTPQLWSCEAPHLYDLRTTISQPGKASEVHDTRFGVRSIDWRTDGFYLNGKRVQLQGVCEHHDLGALGAAFYKRAFERKVKLLKGMGCNAIRTAHNPPAPEFLDVCDENGILVLDELFDIWKAQKYDKEFGYHLDWDAWWKKDVANFVRRDRNHPSVIAWSGGNEIAEIFLPGGAEVSGQLRDEMRKHDATRPFTVGVNHVEGPWNGFGDTLDVMGFNYKPRLYKYYDVTRPNMPFYGSETSSCIGTRDTYFFPLVWGVGNGARAFQVSAYGVAAVNWGNCPDIEFAAQDRVPRVAGEFVWTGFDYLGEPTPYNQDASNVGNLNDMDADQVKAVMEHLKAMGNKAPSRSSYFGIIDLAGFPKDTYYLYQSRWAPHVRSAHILLHWNWPGREGQKTPVMCFSAGDEAELFLNGRSMGIRHKGEGETFTQGEVTIPKNAYRFVWEEVPYEPGELRVVVKRAGMPWAEGRRVTTGPTAKVVAQVDRAELVGDGYDLSFIELTLTDEKGNTVPTDSRAVSFSIEGPAKLVGFCNGNPIDHTCMQDVNQHFFNGRILAVVRTDRGGHGLVEVTVQAEGLPPVKVPLQVQAQR